MHALYYQLHMVDIHFLYFPNILYVVESLLAHSKLSCTIHDIPGTTDFYALLGKEAQQIRIP